jgi:beta-lactamase superfamily II metal-dependent hydrolase
MTMAKRVVRGRKAAAKSKAAARKSATRPRKAAKRRRTVRKARPKAGPRAPSSAPRRGGAAASTDSANAIRVRMYRVGFGDFFLLTVPTKSAGPQHILIDCGVHAGNIGSIADCVADLIAVTSRKLALVIVTHYHADHLSGFATQYDEFAQFEVGAVWITNRLDPKDQHAFALKSQIAALANHLQLQLRLRLRLNLDEGEALVARQALAKAENALGAGLGVAGSGNEKALDLVTKGFKNKPPVYYYQAGDEPNLPAVLKGALTAQILGPVPKDAAGDFAASDNKAEQYLAAASSKGLPDTTRFKPFDREWPADAGDYPPGAFRPWKSPADMEKALYAVQPDALAAAADLLDGTLNNQSLVVLFTCRGRKLLFVGDAQWGNWAYWLYGKAVKGKDPGISDTARKILGAIDFYKVGHHGSTNATPIPAVGAMPDTCAAMCSTETGFPSGKRTYGSIARKTEVPRIALMEALEKQTKRKLVRSDWIAVGSAPASPEAHQQLRSLPANFSKGKLYIDYVFAS